MNWPARIAIAVLLLLVTISLELHVSQATLRATNGNGAEAWVLFRASGTEPLLRLYTEASSPELVRELLRAVVNMRPDLFRVVVSQVPFVDVVNICPSSTIRYPSFRVRCARPPPSSPLSSPCSAG